MAKKDRRYAYEIVSDVWDKLKVKYPEMKIPLRLVDVKAGLTVGTCSALYYGKVKESIHKPALFNCEKGIK